MPTFYCNYFFLLGTQGPLTLGGPLDFAYPAYPIVTPLDTPDIQRDGSNTVYNVYSIVQIIYCDLGLKCLSFTNTLVAY